MALIELESVGKTFSLRRRRGVLMGRGGLGDWVFRRKHGTFDALKDITFSVERGESVGIIGANGSGKSTLLKILAGVTAPTTGRVTIRGRVASLLELGAGFHSVLTGRENIYLNGRILGMSRADIDREFDRIVEFSGIGEFLDNPVETFSSGMYVRLGFAVAVHSNPDLFLVDEVLSVGDEEFQRKCRERIGELREQGKTILFVSHDLSIVNALCQRVILLDRGKMIVRDTPQETIDYYLRQVGRRQGIHTIASGAVEAIVSHGRVSIFYSRREISAPCGFQVHVRSMGGVHSSTAADWNVVARSENGCVAVGTMPRLPLTFTWRLHINGPKLIWAVELECDRALPFDGIDINLFLKRDYDHWVYRDEAGTFPEILPQHQDFLQILPPAAGVANAGAFSEMAGGPSPISVSIVDAASKFHLQWTNSSFTLGSRILQILVLQVGNDRAISPGRHDVLTIEMDLGKTQQEILELRDEFSRRFTLRDGALGLRYADGAFAIFWGEVQLTRAVCLYSSMLIHHVWNDCQNLAWGPVECSGSVMRVSGQSRRFPFVQHWEIDLRDNAAHITVWLEALEEFEAQEYHLSIGLRPEYDRWQTEHESGTFPPFEAGLDDWRHANRDYAPGMTVRALSSAFPSVILKSTARDVPFRMTAVNTGHRESARLLQALRTPDAGRIRFTRGRHLYFQGLVRVEPDEKLVESP